MYSLLASVPMRGTNPLFVPSWPLPWVPWHPAHICSKISLALAGSVCAVAAIGTMISSMVMIVIGYFIRVFGTERNVVDGQGMRSYHVSWDGSSGDTGSARGIENGPRLTFLFICIF